MKTGLPRDPGCLESKLFIDWKIGAGHYQKGKSAGQPIPMKDTGPEKFAILTTRFPGERESDRRIVGLFKIDKMVGNNVVSERGGIRLPMEEARELYFWAYMKAKNDTPAWNEGLFRYVEDGQVHRILHDLVQTVHDQGIREQIADLMNASFPKQVPPPAAGPLREKARIRKDKLEIGRKYGAGGEGPDHKILKEWIR